jgi:hypothetical protein
MISTRGSLGLIGQHFIFLLIIIRLGVQKALLWSVTVLGRTILKDGCRDEAIMKISPVERLISVTSL